VRVKDILTGFEREHMYDADTRRRVQLCVQNYFDVVMASGDVATPFDRMLAGYAIDKFTEYEEILWSKGEVNEN